ncbi:MAG: hypothetical protein ACK5HT_07835 [Draconibacterium sp.]
MINGIIENSIVAGIITTLLMWLDWILSLAQEKERRLHYYEHYQSYPIDTIEGNHIVRKDLEKLKIINLKQNLIAMGLGVFVSFFLKQISLDSGLIFIGFIWGIFLIVNTQHISNLISYRFSRKGIHGKIWMHQRTGYFIQSGRYFATFIFLLILSLLIENLFLYGVTMAAFMSSMRMLIWLKKVPKIGNEDLPPK